MVASTVAVSGVLSESLEPIQQPSLRCRRDKPKDHSPRDKGIGLLSGGFILANCTVGSGLFNMPMVFSISGGIGHAFVAEFVVVVLMLSSCYLTVYCTRKTDSKTFQAVVGSSLGQTARSISNVFIVVQNFGTCILSIILLNDQLKKAMVLIVSSSDIDKWYLNPSFLTSAVVIVVILPLCLYEKFDAFNYTSFLAAIVTIFIAALTVYCFVNRKELGYKRRLDGKYGWWRCLKAVPTLSLLLEGQVELPILLNRLEKRTISAGMTTVALTFVICLVTYSVTGLFGYLTFGDAVTDDIMLMYNPKDKMTMTAIVLIAIKIILVYPPLFFCVRAVADDIVVKIWKRLDHSRLIRRRHIVETIVMVLISVLVGLALPGIGDVIPLLGGSSALFTFVFPSLCYMHIRGIWNLTVPECVLTILLLGMGAFVIGASTTATVQIYLSK